MKKNNNDFPLRSAAKEIKMSFTLTAVVDLVLGCIMLFAPAHVTQLLCMLVGAGITIYGLFNVLSFIFSRGTVAYSFELLIGICATAFGVFSLVNPNFLSKFLFIVLGLLIMVSSICGVKRAFTLKNYGFERWFLMLISAVVTLVLAITIVIYPALYGDMLMMAIGIVMIVEAVSDLLICIISMMSFMEVFFFIKLQKVRYRFLISSLFFFLPAFLLLWDDELHSFLFSS